MTLNEVCLADVRERQIVWRVHDLDGAGSDPAVPAVGSGMGDSDVLPGQGVQGVEQAWLVVLDGTSAAQPAIAVNDRIPATTAPAASASTTATG